MNIIQWLSIGIKWGPHVISAVYLIETLFGSGMTGAEKKEAVMAWLHEQQAKLNLPWGGQVIDIISNMIDTVVGLLNLLGVFKREKDLSPAEIESGKAAAATVDRAGLNEVVESDPELQRFMTRVPQ